MQTKTVDRRGHPRFVMPPDAVIIEVRPAGARDDRWVRARVRDLSGSGVRFESTDAWEPGRAMEARLTFTPSWTSPVVGDADEFHVLGTLVWSSQTDAAIEIKAFARRGDRGRLIRRLGADWCLRAA